MILLVVQEAKTLGVKEEPPSSVEPISKASASAGSDTDTSAITEEEIIRVLRAIAPVRSQDFVPRFKARIRTPEVNPIGFVISFDLKYCVNNFMVYAFHTIDHLTSNMYVIYKLSMLTL